MFDLSTVEKSDSDSVLPAGVYDCMVTEAVVKDTKSGTGEYISMHLTILEGPAKGRKIFTNFNIKNPNPKAVSIGMQQLAGCVSAMGGEMKFESVFDCCTYMFAKAVKVRTKVKKDETYGERAEVVSFAKTTAQGSQDDIGF
jgi:hypothetical protein